MGILGSSKEGKAWGGYPVLKQAQPDEMLPQWKRVEEIPTLTTTVWTGPRAILFGLGRLSVPPGYPDSSNFAPKEDERGPFGPNNNVVTMQRW